MTSFLIAAFLTGWSFTVATPVHHARLASLVEPRQAINCNIGTNTDSNNFATYNSACWNQLNIMPYLTNWTANTPKCTATEDEQACCSISEPWSTCFLRLATGKEGAYDCTRIFFPGSTTCPAPSQGALGLQLSPYLSPDIASQANYVVLNIVMINNFFTANYETLVDMTATESNQLSSLLMTAPNGTDSGNRTIAASLGLENVALNVQDVIGAMILGLVLELQTTPNAPRNPGNPSKRDQTTSSNATTAGNCPKSWEVAYFNDGRHHRRQAQCPQGSPATVNFTTTTNVNGSSSPTYPFTQALRQAPDVATAIWPSKLNTTDTINAAALPGWLLSGASQSILNSLDAGLDVIMNDVGTFIAFAGYGLFSNDPVSTTATFDQMGALAALNTYLVSGILRNNSISATAGPTTGSSGCGTDLCIGSYWSPVTSRQYHYNGGETIYDFLQQMSDSMGLNLPLLFDGAYNCTVAGTAGESIVSINPDSTLNVACLSTLPFTLDEQ